MIEYNKRDLEKRMARTAQQRINIEACGSYIEDCDDGAQLWDYHGELWTVSDANMLPPELTLYGELTADPETI